MMRHLLTLARVSNLPTVWSNCLAAWLISGAVPSWHLIPLLMGASLLYAGGCTLNDAFDAAWDTKHRPERLIPSGVLSRRAVTAIGCVEMATGLGAIFAGGISLVWAPLALAAAIVLYDAWHKQSPFSVTVMGACRWLLYLTAAGAAAATDLFPAMVSGAVLWLYIVVLSLVARGEARRGAATPRSRYLLLFVAAALALLTWRQQCDYMASLSVLCAAAGGFILLLPAGSAPVGMWVNRLLAGIPVIDLCVVLIFFSGHVVASPLWAAAFPAAVLLSLWFQRWFRAT
ncbi:MAG TPA: UbiA family prenyltransferase [Verrucomicrobiales bacterium]|nr:UbiA family prenyltransferase [Verrucomicrobiales bacterium]